MGLSYGTQFIEQWFRNQSIPSAELHVELIDLVQELHYHIRSMRQSITVINLGRKMEHKWHRCLLRAIHLEIT